jgi:hypothetical protein
LEVRSARCRVGFVDRRTLRTLVLLVVLGLLPVTARAATARGHLQLGVLGNPQRFDGQTGQHSRTRLIIVGWGQGSTPEYFTQLLSSMLEQPMIGINADSISPQQIAHGVGDEFLVAINQALAQFHRPVYIRPLAEMNGHWNAYSAYNHDGSSRGASYSTAAFKNAFARIYLIVHGSASANARLHALHLPSVHGALMPAPRVQVVWNPQGYGSPDLPGNTAQAYYPGDAYVDVVGDDLYDIGGKVEWPAADALYAAHPTKPFSLPEWGLWRIDDPSFVTAMAAFLRTHPRTIVANYYSGSAGSIFDLADKPRSRAAYRAAIAPLGR